MGKEDLRSGLEGWIRNTREVAQDLATPEAPRSEASSPRAAKANPASPPPAATPATAAEPPRSAAALLTTMRSELRAITEKAHLLESFEPEAGAAAREALARELVDLAQTLAPQITASQVPAPQVTASQPVTRQETPFESPPSEENKGVTTPVRPIPPDAFRSTVLEAEIPVLVELHLEGYRPSEKARQALAEVAELYDGPVELRTLNVMEAEPQILPQIVKVGRDFLDRNLPKVLLYLDGAKVGEVQGDVSAEDLVELLRSAVN